MNDYRARGGMGGIGYEIDGMTFYVDDPRTLPNQEIKADKGKIKPTLVPPQIIRDIAKVREYGCEKYHDPNNWRKVEKERYEDALLRHTLAWMDARDSKDEESGIEHYKHMACNLAFLCEMYKEDEENGQCKMEKTEEEKEVGKTK